MATIFSTLLSAFFNWFSMILGHVRRRGNLEPGGSTPYMAYTGTGAEVVILWVCPKGITCMIDLICLMKFVCTSSKQKHDGFKVILLDPIAMNC